MITVLHRGVWPNDYSIKSDYVICARPLIGGSMRPIYAHNNWVETLNSLHEMDQQER